MNYSIQQKFYQNWMINELAKKSLLKRPYVPFMTFEVIFIFMKKNGFHNDSIHKLL